MNEQLHNSYDLISVDSKDESSIFALFFPLQILSKL